MSGVNAQAIDFCKIVFNCLEKAIDKNNRNLLSMNMNGSVWRKLQRNVHSF